MIPPAHKAHQTVSFSGCNGCFDIHLWISFTPNAAVLLVDVPIQPEVRFIAEQNSLMKIGHYFRNKIAQFESVVHAKLSIAANFLHDYCVIWNVVIKKKSNVTAIMINLESRRLLRSVRKCLAEDGLDDGSSDEEHNDANECIPSKRRFREMWRKECSSTEVGFENQRRDTLFETPRVDELGNLSTQPTIYGSSDPQAREPSRHTLAEEFNPSVMGKETNSTKLTSKF
ncbi:hypothetical protein TNCV_1094231 [Trichonephila clavipes]|uniref:Uncharacterized protein n=1 Tax=Trichonephila clavipes TaxID=2585209 RepID=A0A8X6V3R8_TRICX|nr:hypothetical protein TNCV_1094231 [Trichonephila clavipes]